ncbi:hypothetical protein EDB19DRAFT_1717402 [Suillus lakei]|nr:hypothetical protein EDB19DRAFT_1717402 [Suillus lakei]
MRLPSLVSFPLVYRLTYATCSYTLFSKFPSSDLSSNPSHSFVYPFLLSLCSPTSISPSKSQARQLALAPCPVRGRAYTHSHSTVYSQLYTQHILFIAIAFLPRTAEGPIAHYGILASLYTAYSTITISSLPAIFPTYSIHPDFLSAPDAGRAYALYHSRTTVYTQLHTQPIPFSRLLLHCTDTSLRMELRPQHRSPEALYPCLVRLRLISCLFMTYDIYDIYDIL